MSCFLTLSATTFLLSCLPFLIDFGNIYSLSQTNYIGKIGTILIMDILVLEKNFLACLPESLKIDLFMSVMISVLYAPFVLRETQLLVYRIFCLLILAS